MGAKKGDIVRDKVAPDERLSTKPGYGRGFVIEFKFHLGVIMIARATHSRFSKSVPS